MQSLHKSRYSFGYKFAISAALLGALVACDQGSKSKNRADKAPDSVTNDIKVNPLKTGTLPKEKTTFYTSDGAPISADLSSSSELTVDPESKTFTYTYSIFQGGKETRTTATGNYDPETGTLTRTSNCDPGRCGLLGDSGTFSLQPANWVGEGRVLLDPNGGRYWGVSPTGRENMPGGKVTYVGTFVGDYSYANFWHDTTDFNDLTGTATTQVNFDTDVLNAKFTDLEAGRMPEGASTENLKFKLEGATIDGDQFSGGSIRLVSPKGGGGSTIPADDVAGQFFGANAEELGGSIYAFDGYSFLRGTWNGTKQ